ncbi:ASST-domain-containing protein [Roridomyces roridus]|uniref:ASST-domain-containing protein n=1 Tax=Roridomyces roridus TaxID=1738132 RepID=A0AAD7FMT2_9AGAR|nr:ASST-domain-containing protein [Roridomyces roridus]
MTPDNTTLFLTCPSGSAVAQSGPTIYKSTGELVWSDPSLPECHDFNIQTFEGEQYLTRWFGQRTIMRSGNGVGIMLNSRYEIHKTALMAGYRPVPADLSPVGSPMNGWYLNTIIQEIDIATGNVLFNWTSIDHIGLNESYGSPTLASQGSSSDTAWDAVHINSIDKDNAGDYLMSSRNCQTIYKIDKNGTIVWRLGGKTSDFTPLTENTQFHWQHHARWRMGGSSISLFDNAAAWLSPTLTLVDENTATGKYLAVDQTKMTVALALEKIFSPSPLSNFSLAMSSIEPYDSPCSSAVIGPNNASLWNDAAILNYRVFQTSTREFMGQPKQPPSVAFSRENGDDEVSVWVSWNGATHVASYELFTGETPDGVNRLLRRQEKDGLEMALSGRGIERYVRVDALARDGSVLGRSGVYRVRDRSLYPQCLQTHFDVPTSSFDSGWLQFLCRVAVAFFNVSLPTRMF